MVNNGVNRRDCNLWAGMVKDGLGGDVLLLFLELLEVWFETWMWWLGPGDGIVENGEQITQALFNTKGLNGSGGWFDKGMGNVEPKGH